MLRVRMFLVAVLAAVGFAATTGLTARPVSSTAIQPNPTSVMHGVVAGGERPVVHWDRFYDRPGGPLPAGLPRNVSTDSLYWKLYSSTTYLYSSPKADSVTPGDSTALAWQNEQTIPCMTPDGHYVFEVYALTMLRTNLTTGAVDTFALADASGGACGTDGHYVYVPKGTTTRKYTLDGALVSATTTDDSCWVAASTFGFGVANDTVWLTPSSAGTTWYGYACAKFVGGSITHDATWPTIGGSGDAMSLTFDGQYYFMTWGGYAKDTLLCFYKDRTLHSTGTVHADARSVMCKTVGYGVMICHGSGNPSYVGGLGQMLEDSSGGRFAAVDTYFIGTGGHATFPATDWYDLGYRAILTFTDYSPEDAATLGDSLARFIQLGGGVVEATFADASGYQIAGNWRSTYAPFTVQSASLTPGTMGTIHQPLHPVISGVSAITMDNFRTGNTPGTLRSTSCVGLAEYTDSHCLVAYFDSAGQRAASLGMFPLTYWQDTAAGQWCRLMVNALNWAAVGPSVGVTAPNGGESLYAGTVHNITWTQTANGASDSIYYSTDGGASWTGVAWCATPPTPLQYAWTVPFAPTTQARVKVVTWDGDGGRVEDKSDADFTIVVPSHDVGVTQIIQPVDTVDSGMVVVPTAVVKNFGGVQETFPVRFSIGGSYTHDTTVTVGSGVTDTVAFPQWVAGPVGTFEVRCSTRLGSDVNNANDRATDTVVVKPSGGIEQSKNNALPRAFALHQPYPNPLASSALIRYDLPCPTQVELRIYDVSGTLVRRLVGGAQTAGYRSTYWNGCDDRGRMVAPGVYYCRFAVSDFRATQKLVVRR
ncbi:MAG TPA: FlgD immunoglobulin-like domain containing protein [bacterium]|nr:FlgD immunoglobulin-like domain containing protein [bacterium]